MNLKTRITEDMKSAMRARDSARLSTIRLLLAAVKQREVDERIVLDDPAVIAVIDKMIKQRRESIVHFEAGKRPELAAAERAEIELLQSYLPQRMSEAEVDDAIAAAIASEGAGGMAAMGKVMAALKAKLAGRVDMAQVSAKVKAKLSG